MRNAFLLITMMFLAGCGAKPTQLYPLPLQTAWFDGQQVHYITTDVSDQIMAREMGANYAPRLRDAIPRQPRQPGFKTVLERVYAFPGKIQPSVFPSAPWPVGPESTNKPYSPLWLMHTVTWIDPTQAYELKSEGEIHLAEAAGKVIITQTDIVVNCPVVPSPYTD